MRKRAWRSRDDGMTLIELLITIAMIGAITSVISLGITLVAQSRQSIGGDLATTRHAQTLALWLPADLQCADPGAGFVTNEADTGGCGAPLPGLNRLRIGLHPGNGGPSIVSYRIYGTEAPYLLIRVTCLDSAAPPILRSMVGDIADPSDVTVSLLPPATTPPTSIEFDIATSNDGETLSFTVGGGLKAITPASTLP